MLVPTAATWNKFEVLQLLLDAGANKDQANSEGETPLMLAAQRAHSRIVRVLLQAGARKDMIAKCGNSALMWVSGTRYMSLKGHDVVETIQVLLRALANVNLANRHGD